MGLSWVALSEFFVYLRFFLRYVCELSCTTIISYASCYPNCIISITVLSTARFYMN